MGIDLGINDYDDREFFNMWTKNKKKEILKISDYLAIKAAGNNKDVLSILMTSNSIPIEIKYEVIKDYKLEQFYNMVYNSDLDVNEKLILSIIDNNYSVFEKNFDDSDNKQHVCVIVSFKNVDDKFAEKCLESNIGKGLKYNISKKYGIGDAEQYYEEPVPSNDEDLSF